MKFVRCLLGKNDEDLLPSGYFDIVCSVSVIEDIREENWSSLFRSASRVLRPRGLFINTVDMTFSNTGKATRLFAAQSQAGISIDGDPSRVFTDADPVKSLLEHPGVSALLYKKADENGNYVGHETTVLSVGTKA